MSTTNIKNHKDSQLPIETPKASTFKKFDNGKLQYNLLPHGPIQEVIKVLMVGAEKYDANNWRDNHQEVTWSRYMNAMERHYNDFKSGEDFDKETNLYELAHMLTNGIFLLYYQLNNLGVDDRYKLGDTNDTSGN